MSAFDRNTPFYMKYPLPMQEVEEDKVLRDLEYLQQMYPKEAKKYQKRIAEILDKLDYEGSMIYDEYPDRWMLRRMADNILNIIKNEASEDDTMQNWEWIEEFIQILMFYEIYKRRHGGKRTFLNF